MPRASANGIELEYQTFGDPGDQPLVLISGLATQMISWQESFCELLASRGFFVIRFDNRDVGLSTWMDGAGPPGPAASSMKRSSGPVPNGPVIALITRWVSAGGGWPSWPRGAASSG